jgi:hypothetical protein
MHTQEGRETSLRLCNTVAGAVQTAFSFEFVRVVDRGWHCSVGAGGVFVVFASAFVGYAHTDGFPRVGGGKVRWDGGVRLKVEEKNKKSIIAYHAPYQVFC